MSDHELLVYKKSPRTAQQPLTPREEEKYLRMFEDVAKTQRRSYNSRPFRRPSEHFRTTAPRIFEASGFKTTIHITSDEYGELITIDATKY